MTTPRSNIWFLNIIGNPKPIAIAFVLGYININDHGTASRNEHIKSNFGEIKT